MKYILYFLLLVIAAVGARAIVIHDTIYYAPTSNTTVYIVDTAIADAITVGNSQINLSGYIKNDYVYSSRGELIYSPTGANTSLVSFGDGRYYQIYDTPHHYDRPAVRFNPDVQAFCKQTYTIYILLGVLIIAGIAGAIITLITTLAGSPMLAVMSIIVTTITVVTGVIVTISFCSA